MRVAIVHDWLYITGGAERVLAEIFKCFPDADLFTLFNFLSEDECKQIGIKSVKTSFLQKMPFIKKHHRSYLPLMPFAIEQFDLSEYDLVISSSYAVARGVITGPNQIHVSYVHSPMRYAWDLQNFYLKQSGRDKGIGSFIARVLLYHMRMWDVRTAHGPDAMIANSNFVARRIRKIYGRSSTVIYPPVNLADPIAIKPRGSHFLAASRLVPYKNIDVIVKAFTRMPDLSLVVAGTGPELDKLKAMAGPNIIFTGWVTDIEMRELMTTARAFIFAAEEDFGIVPVEAQAEGTPVLALGRGGALETIKGEGPGKTGMFFPEATPEEIVKCVRNFTEVESEFSRSACRKQAETFSAEAFGKKFMSFIEMQIRHVGAPQRRTHMPVTGMRHRTMR
jgi:glycosyltransferase involved in cell wall biosynthesis